MALLVGRGDLGHRLVGRLLLDALRVALGLELALLLLDLGLEALALARGLDLVLLELRLRVGLLGLAVLFARLALGVGGRLLQAPLAGEIVVVG